MFRPTGSRGSCGVLFLALFTLGGAASAGELNSFSWNGATQQRPLDWQSIDWRAWGMNFNGGETLNSGNPSWILGSGPNFGYGDAGSSGSTSTIRGIHGLNGSFSAGTGNGGIGFLEIPNFGGASGNLPTPPGGAWERNGMGDGMYSPILPIVPLPPAAWLGLAGFAGLLLMRRRMVKTAV